MTMEHPITIELVSEPRKLGVMLVILVVSLFGALISSQPRFTLTL